MKSGNVDGVGQKWITFANGSDPNGFVRDGDWHVVEIPMDDITADVDLFCPGSLDEFAAILRATGFLFDADKKEFVRNGVPVHLVSTDQIPTPPKEWIDIDGIRTVNLVDLINMKLKSGCRNLLRSQDLADVIGLIRKHGLESSYAGVAHE